MSDKNRLKSKSIYGLFNSSSSIDEVLKNGNKGDIHLRNICHNGYQIAAGPVKNLFVSEKIYNSEEIRQHLNYLSGNTADLILELINREGVSGCRRLNGKFTIILCENEKTTIIRDRNGEGPMVYFTNDFYTDSYSGLTDFKNFSAEPDMTGIKTFLKIGYIPAPLTSLKGVSKVPAGAILYHTRDGFHYGKLFDFEEIIKSDRKSVSLPEAVETYSDLLKKSLKRRIGDAETVGVLLSGGYDSGGNIAMSRLVHSGKIKTYSIGFKDNPASELPYAKLMADQYGAEHHEYLMDGTEIEFLPDIIDALGDPFSESGFMLNYTVMKMVGSENLPVSIGGDGNDQYFGAGIRETALHYKMHQYGLAPFAKLFDNLSDNRLFDNDNIAFRVHFQNQKILRVRSLRPLGFMISS
ncbi:MAG: hypothetical protein IPJ37_19900 [Bacteroidales bacterium]|nr:hypothetical protein [Bacteroidales bacterium]